MTGLPEFGDSDEYEALAALPDPTILALHMGAVMGAALTRGRIGKTSGSGPEDSRFES